MRSKNGFSLLEVMVTLGLIGGVAIGGMNLMTNFKKTSDNFQQVSDIMSVRSQIIATLQDANSFEKTITHTTNKHTFNCISSALDCTGASGEFKIYRSMSSGVNENPHVSLSSEENIGLTKDGGVCYTFNGNPEQGNDGCPYKYIATWSAVCVAPASIKGAASQEVGCKNPAFDIWVKLLINHRHGSKFQPIAKSKAEIHLTFSQAASERGRLCQMVPGGYFDEASESCVFVKQGETSCENFCPSGVQVLVMGFYSDGSLKCSCSAVAPLGCNAPGSAGSVTLGVNDNGSLICGDGLMSGLMTSGSINHNNRTYYNHLVVLYNTSITEYNKARAVANTANDNHIAAVNVMTLAQENAKQKEAAAKVAIAAAAAANPPNANLTKVAKDLQDAADTAAQEAVDAEHLTEVALVVKNASELTAVAKAKEAEKAKEKMDAQGALILKL